MKKFLALLMICAGLPVAGANAQQPAATTTPPPELQAIPPSSTLPAKRRAPNSSNSSLPVLAWVRPYLHFVALPSSLSAHSGFVG